MAKWDENKFEVSLGRLRSPSGSRRAVGIFEQVSRGARAKRRGGLSKRSSGGSVRPMAFYRRVVVKASIKKMAGHGFDSFRKHLAYIERDGTDERGERAKSYGSGLDDIDIEAGEEADSKPTKAFADRCKDDRHHFRFVVTPEDSSSLLSLSEFTTDLVTQMETDLGTKLDWVAADHYDTGQPHTHLVIRGVRDDGEDLVIPRKYISHTLRRRAQDLVEMELGPVTQIEGRVRLAHQVNAERFTGIDKSFAKEMAKGELNMSKAAPTGRVWHRQLQVKRLHKLSQMGLAENMGSGRWRLAPNYAQTLKDMGERGDIIKAIHRSLKDEGHTAALVTERNRFDPSRPTARPVTGVVKQFGRHDDTREGGFVIIRSLDGEHIHTKVSEDETFETLQKGQVITLQPHQQGPRKIDHSIADFAKTHDGIYSEARHATEGGNVSPAYAQAHVRRLEALRQKKLVIRHQDETWHIPKDYLERASNYEAERGIRIPTQLDRRSTQKLSQMETARGVTWLDERLVEHGPEGVADKVMHASILKRQTELKKMGYTFEKDGRLQASAIDQLRDMDLSSASNGLSETYGKSYTPLGDARQVEGVFQETIERPSGKFAVIERSRDFTLVPWRPVMEKSLGRSISGRISGGGISWDVTKQRGLSR